MGKKKLPEPTEGELAILAVLWQHGPATVRQVHDALAARGTGYTTTLKLMQLMAEKGLVRRNEDQRSHVYRAAVSQADTQGRLVRQLIDRAFAGSGAELAMRALAVKPASREELDDIRRMIDAIEAENPSADEGEDAVLGLARSAKPSWRAAKEPGR
jgi:BlaI family penicillinase repressor